MKFTTLLLALLCAAAPVFARTPLVAINVPSTTVTRSATIQLGAFPGISEVVLLPRVPTTLAAGTHAQILAPAPGTTYGPVQWFKDSTRLAAADATLDFAAVTVADSGNYTAFVKNADGTTSQSDSITMFVTVREGQRTINVSTLARIDAAQPSFLSGFVVEPGPATKLMLIRAIGPALAAFGIAAPLAAPQFRVFNARGQEVAPVNRQSIYRIYPTAADAAQLVGAFPLPANSKDIALLFELSAGAYTAQLSSADSGSGTALLEIYDVM